jgi:hypothetical protein
MVLTRTFLRQTRRVGVAAAMLAGVLSVAQAPAKATGASAVPAPSAAVTAAAFTTTGSIATDGDMGVQTIHMVCANDIWLRNAPGSSYYIGLLYGGEWVDYQYSITGWSYVYSYKLARYGWIQSGYLC